MLRRTIFALLAPLAAGCEFTSPGAPTNFPKTSVEGTILLGGRPLPDGGAGWMTFFPEGPSLGDVTVCRLKADGGYRCDRVPVGPLNVRLDVAPSVLASAPIEVRRWVQVLRGPASPLRITTWDGKVTRFDFDLRAPAMTR